MEGRREGPPPGWEDRNRGDDIVDSGSSVIKPLKPKSAEIPSRVTGLTDAQKKAKLEEMRNEDRISERQDQMKDDAKKSAAEWDQFYKDIDSLDNESNS